MKKALSIALTLMLTLSLLCMGAFAEATDFTGTWYTRMYGVEIVFVLNEGGAYTVSFNAMGETEESEGTWEVTSAGVVFDKGTADEVVLTYDAQANSLTGMISGMELVFTRESVAAFELAPARSDAAPEEYDGKWAASLFCLGEIQATTQDAQIDLFMTVEGGLNCLTMINAGESSTINIVPVFSDGAMLLYLDVADRSTPYVIVCQLLEDDSMSAAFPVEMFGQEAVFVLERV